jgi:hypothetical protein
MVTECQLCNRAIEHCHGTLVLHSDATIECTDELCEELQVDLHELVLECRQVAGGCECAEVSVHIRATA